MVKIVTDSTSDIPHATAAELDIRVVPVMLDVDGATELDGVTLSRSQFYANLDSYREMPKTAAPSTEYFVSAYRDARSHGADQIISVHLNRRFSALINAAEVAARDAAAEGIRVHVVDSETTSMGLGWIAISAARMAAEGARMDAIIQRIDEIRPRVYLYALVDTLKYLRRSGRANVVVAGIGDMLQIKVLIGVHSGLIEQIDRIRTRARGIARLIELAHRHQCVQHLSVLHTSNGMASDVSYLQSQLTDLCPVDRQFALQVTPVLGAHVGPMAVGIVIVADV